MNHAARYLLLIVLFSFLVRWPLLSAGFIDFDDRVLLYENEIITWLNQDHLYQVALTNFRFERQNMMYLANLLNYAAAGGDYLGFITVNLAWWGLTVCLLHAFAGLFLEDPRARLAAAALFSVHAINTDTIAWISARGHLLGLPFALAALTVWGHRPRERLAPLWVLASTALLGLAIYAKLVFVGAFVGLICIDVHQGRSARSWKTWAAKLPALVLIYLVTPYPGGRITPDVTDQQRFFARCSAMVNYLYALFVPIPTSLETWDAPGRTLFDLGGSGMPASWLPPVLHLLLLALVGIGLLVLYRRGVRTPLLMAVLAVALIGPSMVTRAQIPGMAVSYRYALGASACFSVGFVALLEPLWNGMTRRERLALIGGFALLLGAHATRSNFQSRLWQEPEAVFANCVEHFPATWLCHLKLQIQRSLRTGDRMAGAGMVEESVYQRSLLDNRGRHLDSALFLSRMYAGKPEEIDWVRRSLAEDELNPDVRKQVESRLQKLEAEQAKKGLSAPKD